MDDVMQDEIFMDLLVLEMRSDEELWHAVIERIVEGNLIQKISDETGRRRDLEPEYFPQRKRPSLAELTSRFLKQKFGKDLPRINTQLALKVIFEARNQI